MADYDISQAFEKIENELIDSMMRNFSRHRAEELKEGYNWAQWQAEQLKSLEKYRKNNAKKFNRQFSKINSKITEMLKTARADGNAHQEFEILKAIKNGFKFPDKPSASSTAEFFKLNDRKINALIKATTDDLKKAETAILRMSNDKYRKAIFNAQVYANSGAGTYEKSVDMACKDMLQAGLNCVEYKNGARHTLSDYADMAIRTANKRAYLYGEGEKRAEWGISTVVVNSRQGGCPDCAKYIGRVFIDDVYSNGKRSDGNYPLLSTAIMGGLFHPRCKDSTSTYYEGITTLKKVSKSELLEMKENEVLEQQKSHVENQAKKCDRIAKYSLDDDNRRLYQNRAEMWQDKADKIDKKITDKPVAKSVDSGIIKAERETSPRKNKKGDFSVDWSKIQSDEYSNKFKKLSENKRVYSSIETRAKWSLNNRDGLDTEEMYAIDLTNGNEVAKITDQQHRQGVKRTSLFTKKLNEADNKGHNILLLHNHPNGLPPSINDINVLFDNKNVSGITVGHNGSIYHYTRPKMSINMIDYNVKLRHYKNLDEIECIEKALFDLQEKFGFTITKL